ncbi:CDP-alcohol phosphatidyltransferase family protein, partial [Flavobacteriales bacterium]|nr:CDP-alcohol phosphatidyltransferase family protein [Flavobacteriales bacterium]
MNIKKHIPNFITILNLVCGVFAILFFIKSVFVIELIKSGGENISFSERTFIQNGIYLILTATVLDFLDG